MENYPVELLEVAELLDAEAPEAPLDLPALEAPVPEDPAEPLPDESELEPFAEVAAESEPADADLPDSRLSVR